MNQKLTLDGFTENFSREYIETHRYFPRIAVFLLLAASILQVLAGYGIVYFAMPKEYIDEYTVTVSPLADGSLDVTYSFVWTRQKENAQYPNIRIGMNTENCTLYEDSLSERIADASISMSNGYPYVFIQLKEGKSIGETDTFSFKVNQKDMAFFERDLFDAKIDTDIYSFLYRPYVFAHIPVRSFHFIWQTDETVIAAKGYDEISGSLKPGESYEMRMEYPVSAFAQPIETNDAFYTYCDTESQVGLYDSEIAGIAFCGFFILFLLFVELLAADCILSYYKGHGFIRGFGCYMHTYGCYSPLYKSHGNTVYIPSDFN